MIHDVADGLWEVVRPMRLAGMLDLGHRMTLVRCGDGGLLVHSPVALDAEVATAVDALGPVRAIVAPSRTHDLWLAPWLERYPRAAALAPPELISARPDLGFRSPLDDASLLPLDAGLEAVAIEGAPRVGEVVLIHRPSRTAIVADLVFNFPQHPDALSRFLVRLITGARQPAASRLYRMLVRDRAAFERSLDLLCARDFMRLVPGHGEMVTDDPRTALRRAWSMADRRARGRSSR